MRNRDRAVERNNALTDQLFRSVLLVNIISMVSSIACIMVDAIVTGQFLGSDAVASMGLIQPVIRICSLIGPIFGVGIGIVCTRYMGMARIDRVNQVFSVVMTVLVSIGVVLSVGLFLCAPLLGGLLGGKTGDAGIVRMITGYFRGFSIGMPFFVMTIVLPGLLMIDNDRVRGLVAVVAALIVDAACDLLNVTVFHGGMFGMALASSISNIVGFLFLASHFLKKDRVLRFCFAGMKIEDLKEVFLNGVPNAIASGSTALRLMIFNVFLLSIASKTEVSAYSAADSAFSLILAVVIAFYMSTSTVCSLFFGEEDRGSIIAVLGRSMRLVLVLLGMVMFVMLGFASEAGNIFLKTDNGNELLLAAFFIRCMATEYFLMGISYSLSGAYQGTRRMGSSYLLVALREAVFPVACALAFGALFGAKGVGMGLVAAGFLTFLSCFALPAIKKHKPLSPRAEDMIMLEEDFGARPEDTFEASISNMEGVMDASNRARLFFQERDAGRRTAFMTALFIEELCGNTIMYGFPDGKEKRVDVRIVCGKDKQVIRIKDTGKPFDPVEWYRKNNPEDPASGIGIRIVIGLAKDVRYVPALGMNNLMIETFSAYA